MDDFQPLRMYCYHFSGFTPEDALNSKDVFYSEFDDRIEIYIGSQHPKYTDVVGHELRVDIQNYSNRPRQKTGKTKTTISPHYAYVGSKVTFGVDTGQSVIKHCQAAKFGYCRAGVMISAETWIDTPCWRGSGIRCASKTYKREEVPDLDEF